MIIDKVHNVIYYWYSKNDKQKIAGVYSLSVMTTLLFLHFYLINEIFMNIGLGDGVQFTPLKIVVFHIAVLLILYVRYFRISKIAKGYINSRDFMTEVYPKRFYYLAYIVLFLIGFCVSPFLLVN